jgi:AcrR family transcriptional regulator
MPRTRPVGRLDALVDAAAEAFSRNGYRRTQMADVARALGVSAGTLYGYVAGKEALFDLVVQRAFLDEPQPPPELPVPTPERDELAAHVRRRLGRRAQHRWLEAALSREGPPADPAAEVAGVVGELFDYLSRHHRGLALLERCAADRPELAELYFGRSRRGLHERLERWIALRTEQRVFRQVPDVEATARLVVESAAYVAWKRHGDPVPGGYTPDAGRSSVVTFVSRALLSEGSP